MSLSERGCGDFRPCIRRRDLRHHFLIPSRLEYWRWPRPTTIALKTARSTCLSTVAITSKERDHVNRPHQESFNCVRTAVLDRHHCERRTTARRGGERPNLNTAMGTNAL